MQEVKSEAEAPKVQQQEMDFITREPPMAYQPPKEAPTTTTTAMPINEPGPRMVTPLEKLGSKSASVDCPYCRRVRTTEIRQVEAGDDGMIKCLICLVCWPMLFCYEGNKDLNHHCSVCKRQLTTQPSGTGRVLVVADANPHQPQLVASQFEQAS